MTNSIANTDQFAAEENVISMWGDERIQNARRRVGGMFAYGYGDSIPAEMRPQYDEVMDEYMTNYLFKAAASDDRHPGFVRNFMAPHNWRGRDVPGARMGGDNPDNCYRLAGICHGTAYRVTGRVADKKPANISFTLTGNYGTTVTIQTLEDHQLEWEPDGSFIITIDDKPANGRPNHLRTAPRVKFLFVRDTMNDWATETPLDLQIECLGDTSAPPVSLDEMVERAVFRACEDVPLYHWFQRAWSATTVNTVRPPQFIQGLGGLVTQALSFGNFQLGDDDAVILDYGPAGAGYSAVQLADWLSRSIDCGNIQSSLNTTQSVVDSDGRVRVVVAKHDPGVANWLDTGGLSSVIMLMRWQALPPQSSDKGLSLNVKPVKLSELASELPAETARFNGVERKAQIEARRLAFQRRFYCQDGA